MVEILRIMLVRWVLHFVNILCLHTMFIKHEAYLLCIASSKQIVNTIVMMLLLRWGGLKMFFYPTPYPEPFHP